MTVSDGWNAASVGRRERRLRTAAWAGLLGLSICGAGCQRSEVGRISAPPAVEREQQISDFSGSAAQVSSQGHYALGIVGYNYMEVGVFDYMVNGIGAFDLAVSNGDAGGGKTACCFGWAPAAKLPMPIRVEWTRDGETWCRKTAMLTEAGPPEPTTLEVHFYPDRHIEVAVTDVYSPSRLKLDRAGRDFRVAQDVQREMQDAIALDARTAECRAGRFSIGRSS